MNSTRARVLRGLKSGSDGLPVELIMKSEARKLRDSMYNGPESKLSAGRNGQRSTIENGSRRVDEDQRDFIGQVFALLESHRRAGEFDKLAVFAEPSVLGVLRQLMPTTLRNTVICEVPKNLVHLSVQDLPTVVLEELDH